MQPSLAIVPFVGVSRDSMSAAMDAAYEAVRAWYAEQALLYYSCGSLIFQLSTAAYTDNGTYTFIVTVFNPRSTMTQMVYTDRVVL